MAGVRKLTRQKSMDFLKCNSKENGSQTSHNASKSMKANISTVVRYKFNHLATNSTTFAAFPWPLCCTLNITKQNRNKVQGAIVLPALEICKNLLWFRSYKAVKFVDKSIFSKNILTLNIYQI